MLALSKGPNIDKCLPLPRTTDKVQKPNSPESQYSIVTYIPVARQRRASNDENTVGSGVFYVIRPEAISRDRPTELSSVSAVEWSRLVGE
jgi:hypothetical protein